MATFGKVVDWILVEIWSNFEEHSLGYPYMNYDLLATQALILKSDGKVLDTAGRVPKFLLNTTNQVRVVVKHRNHLTAISNELFSPDEDIEYDFSNNILQAIHPPYSTYPGLVLRNGVACLWAGDLNENYFIDNQDITLLLAQLRQAILGEYLTGDVNMDGFVDSLDESFITRSNAKYGVFSSAYFFRKR